MRRLRAGSCGAKVRVALAWLVWPAVTLAQPAAQPTELARAREALRNLGYSEARPLLEVALKQGGHPQRELLEIYALRAEIEAVLDGPEASEREFRKLLVLDPRHPSPARESPTFVTPYRNALAWVNSAGTLKMEHPGAQAPRDAQSFQLVERVVSDPLAMVASLQVYYRERDGAPYVKLATTQLKQEVPVPPAEASYYIDVLDAHGNVLTALGASESPLRVTLTEPGTRTEVVDLVTKKSEIVQQQPPPHVPRWYESKLGWILVGGGAASLAAGAALFGLAAQAVSAASSAQRRDDYATQRDRAILFDATGAALVAVGAALVIGGAVVMARRGRPARVAVSTWGAPGGVGVILAGGF